LKTRTFGMKVFEFQPGSLVRPRTIRGEDLVRAKRAKNKVSYWITFRLPGGKQRKEFVGYSIEEARAAEGKRRGQKKENRIFEMLPEARMTFDGLIDWYLDFKSVRRLNSYKRVCSCLANFRKQFGSRLVSSLQPLDLEDYQDSRDGKGTAPATIDMELSIAQTMVIKAFDNDMIDARVLKALRRIKRRLKKGSNARDRILSFEEYQRLLSVAVAHLKAILIVAFNTGMRKGEILNLRWSQIDQEKGFIRIPADRTKERKAKCIPINHHVQEVLDNQPRALHHDFVFTIKGKPIEDLRKAFKSACKAAGILYGLRFHDIRTTVKTNMLRAGVDKALRDIILGHSLNGMDAYYLKPTEDDLRKAMDLYTEWLDKQLARPSSDLALGGQFS
jgi:integrase